MALINRMSRLLTADVHAVLDRIEEPDVLLRHAVREMEDEVARSEQHVKQLEHERDRLADRHRKVQAALAEIEEQISIAFHASNDELARKLVKRLVNRVAILRQPPRDQCQLRPEAERLRSHQVADNGDTLHAKALAQQRGGLPRDAPPRIAAPRVM